MSSEWPDLGRDPRLDAGDPLPGMQEGHMGTWPPEDGSSVRTSPSRRIDAWYFLGGWVAGAGVIDVLDALGLHWLKWPVVVFLIVFAIGVTVQGRRADRRKNSGDDGI